MTENGQNNSITTVNVPVFQAGIKVLIKKLLEYNSINLNVFSVVEGGREDQLRN